MFDPKTQLTSEKEGNGGSDDIGEREIRIELNDSLAAATAMFAVAASVAARNKRAWANVIRHL